MKITRYCPICKHTTKHEYDGKGTFTCLSRTHGKHVKEQKK